MKDVKDQRDQLYRKLDALRSKGIELAPNMAVLKSDPSVAVPPSGEVVFFHADESPEMALKQRSPSTAPSQQPSSGVRKTSSMSGVSNPTLLQATTVATGGSLKKDSFANLNLMSATNETKQSVVGGLDKQEIRQQIPVKLSSKLSVSTRGSTSTSALSSAADKKKASMMSSAASVSQLPAANKGADGVHQLLPFKLSEAPQSTPPQQQLSPGRHKLSSSSFGDASSRLAPFQPPYDTLHQRTGSSPHLVAAPGAGGGLQPYLQPAPPVPVARMNTLPKKDPKHVAKDRYGGPAPPPPDAKAGDDDKVIYF